MIDLTKYSEFVKGVTAEAAVDLTTFMDACDRLDGNCDATTTGPDINVPLIISSCMGLCGEAGEFSEIFKKAVFHQSAPLVFTEEKREHAIKELGDIIWYWTNACMAIHVDPNDVIQRNITKLMARYPGGVFSATLSENKNEDDE